MDVARINMITPKQIDWRKLTAKDIIKYDAQGMEIPSQYLQWARAFHVDLEKNDTDETTYEMAVSKPATRTKNGLAKNQPTQNQTENVDNIDNSDNKEEEINTQKTPETDNEGDKTGTEVKRTDKDQTTDKVTKDGETQQTDENEENNTTETNEKNPNEPLTAEQFKKKLEDEGKSLFGMGKAFKDESNKRTDSSKQGESTISALGDTSNDAIATLDSYMSNLLAEADNINSKIEAQKNKKDSANKLSKIQQLQKQLEALGKEGQITAIGFDTELSEFQPIIDAGIPLGTDAQQYGDETQQIGRKIMGFIAYYSSGRKIEAAGKNAVNAGSSVSNTSTNVGQSNQSNLQSVHQDENSIMSKTGVSASEVMPKEEQQGNDNQNTDNKAKTNEQSGNSNGATTLSPAESTDTKAEKELAQKEKDEQNISDDKKTDVEKKEEKIASGNLDELLKRKLRRGEVEVNA